MTTTNGCAACASQPFRIFFVLAAGTAAAGVLPWLIGGWPVGLTAAVWHRETLLFGMVPAVLAGFVLTALPRWTRSPPVPERVVRVLMALWLAGRLVHLWSPGVAAPIGASFLLTVAMLVAVRVVKAGGMREIKVVFLLILLATAAAAPDVMPADFRLRLALAAILGLIAVIGGRIAPALTASYSALRGAQFGRRCLAPPRSRLLSHSSSQSGSGASTLTAKGLRAWQQRCCRRPACSSGGLGASPASRGLWQSISPMRGSRGASG